MFASGGTRPGLIPHPAAEPSSWIVLVEGAPDVISAPLARAARDRRAGPRPLGAGVGAAASGRHVSMVVDCDRAGRRAAARIAVDLKAAGGGGSIVDLARARTDGYDLTEWLADRENLVPCETDAAAAISRCESPSRPGAADGVLVFAVGVALALSGTRYLPQHVSAELAPSALLALAFGVGDRAQPRAAVDRGAGRPGRWRMGLRRPARVVGRARRRRLPPARTRALHQQSGQLSSNLQSSWSPYDAIRPGRNR
jgi:hypothetical protein